MHHLPLSHPTLVSMIPIFPYSNFRLSEFKFFLIFCICNLHKFYLMNYLAGSEHFGYAFVGSAAALFGACPMPHLSPCSSSLPPIPPHHYYHPPHLRHP